jgi:hypothetical protein
MRHVKDPYSGVEVAIVGKIIGRFSPIVPPFPARGLSRRCRCGGAWRCKWELPKHRVDTISLQAAVHSWGGNRRGPEEEEEEEEEEEKEVEEKEEEKQKKKRKKRRKKKKKEEEEEKNKKKLLITHFSPIPCHLVPLRPKYSPQHPILKQDTLALIHLRLSLKQ